MEIVQVILVLLITGVLIVGFLCLLPVTLEGHGCASWVMRVNVEHRVGNMSIEGPTYLGVFNVGGQHEVFEGVHGDVILMGKDVP